MLDRPKPPKTVIYVHENALRSQVGGPRVMNEQLLHMVFLGDRLGCAIRVIPASTGARGMTIGSFNIFRYKDDKPVICVQHETTSEFLEDDEEMASYRRILDRVANVALDGAQSRSFLAELATNYERRGDAESDTGGLAQE